MVGTNCALFRAVDAYALAQRLQVAGPNASSRMHREIEAGIAKTLAMRDNGKRSVGMGHRPHDYHGVSVGQRKNNLYAFALDVRQTAGRVGAGIEHISAFTKPPQPGGEFVLTGYSVP